jgi:hypothetical protein
MLFYVLGKQCLFWGRESSAYFGEEVKIGSGTGLERGQKSL